MKKYTQIDYSSRNLRLRLLHGKLYNYRAISDYHDKEGIYISMLFLHLTNFEKKKPALRRYMPSSMALRPTTTKKIDFR